MSEFTWNQEKLAKEGYLNDVRFSKIDIQILFALRTRMVDVKCKYRNLYNNNLECQTCDDKSVIEDENHILNCEQLKTVESVQIKFKDVFGCVEKQLKAVRIFKNILRKRETIIELSSND